MIHALKIKTEYFDKVISGEKTAEIRKNDRGFKVGDYLALNEEIEEINYTGRSCLVQITDIVTDTEYMKEGYALLSFHPCRIETHKRLPAEAYGEIDILDIG